MRPLRIASSAGLGLVSLCAVAVGLGILQRLAPDAMVMARPPRVTLATMFERADWVVGGLTLALIAVSLLGRPRGLPRTVGMVGAMAASAFVGLTALARVALVPEIPVPLIEALIAGRAISDAAWGGLLGVAALLGIVVARQRQRPLLTGLVLMALLTLTGEISRAAFEAHAMKEMWGVWFHATPDAILSLARVPTAALVGVALVLGLDLGARDEEARSPETPTPPAAVSP